MFLLGGSLYAAALGSKGPIQDMLVSHRYTVAACSDPGYISRTIHLFYVAVGRLACIALT